MTATRPAAPTARFEFDVDEFERSLADAAKELGKTADEEIDRLGELAADRIRDYVPVGSERKLYDSIDSRPGTDEDGHFVEVGSFDVWYAVFVEMGTSEQEAQPFVLPGLEEARRAWSVL